MNHKITSKQLERTAYVYIRQSTLQQVRQNQESSRRQYALRERAQELGFREVIVIDDDLGITGSGQQDRPGFGRLLAAVCSGCVGAVFALEASRLARNNRDWHHLIDLCVLTETIVVDTEGVYDPRLLNDRLLLGLKGTMSEFELGILRQRALEAYRAKVLRGEVLTRVPMGYVRSGANSIEMTPDREIQEAVRGVFVLFRRMGSLRQALLWYHQEKLLLPLLRVKDGRSWVEWQVPNYQSLLRIIKNPTYAGAFAYGRTGSRSQVVGDRSRKTGGHKVPMNQWQALIKEHHSAYISWDEYMENQRILTSNRTKTHPVSCGAAKKGKALLSGLLRCARCGHKLHVGYRGRDGRAPRYYCMTGNSKQGKPSCLSFGGTRAEEALVSAVLEACRPIGVEASMEALKGNRLEQEQKLRMLSLALERARYEAGRAQSQYDAVDPSNRLVASELEARWNTALEHVAEAQRHLELATQTAKELTEEQRQRLLALGSNLHAAWHHPEAPVELKKRILRTVIHEIIVDINHPGETVEMRIHWAGGVHTLLPVRKNKCGRNAKATDMDIVELVRKLAQAQSDSQIAATLNRIGCHTGPGNSWNTTRVKNLRLHHRIAVYDDSVSSPWVTMAQAAIELKTGIGVLRTMINRQVLPAQQSAKSAPWMIQRKDLQRIEVLNYINTPRHQRRSPRENNNQLILPSL
jgi:DNA invertase Pin-like site-specific DNA recombinase